MATRCNYLIQTFLPLSSFLWILPNNRLLHQFASICINFETCAEGSWINIIRFLAESRSCCKLGWTLEVAKLLHSTMALQFLLLWNRFRLVQFELRNAEFIEEHWTTVKFLYPNNFFNKIMLHFNFSLNCTGFCCAGSTGWARRPSFFSPSSAGLRNYSVSNSSFINAEYISERNLDTCRHKTT